MSRINCHSAFKHYDMFHSHGGDSINIGSNNTTIFNCSGHSGGFWSGVGLGLGNAFGSIFGGMFGNFGGFGGFGMGGFGMGGFGFGMGGFPMFGGLDFGNYLGYNIGGSSTRSNKSDSSDSSLPKKNVDYAKLNELFKRKNDILAKANPKLDELEKLKNDIESLKNSLDKVDDDNDRNYIKQLERGLDDAIANAKNDETVQKPAEVKPEADETTKPTEAKSATETANAPAAAQSTDDTENAPEDAQFNGKTIDEIKAMPTGELKEFLEALSPEDRAKVKAAFYLDGYKNYDGNTAVTKDNFKVVHDTGLGINADIINVVDVAADTPPKTITMKTTNKPQDVTYTYQGTKDGEYLYKSSVSEQIYVLQQHGEEFTLVQYKYHDGWNKVDVHQK